MDKGKMNRKIKNLLEKDIADIIELQEKLKAVHHSEYLIELETKRQIETISSKPKLINTPMYELNPTLDQLEMQKKIIQLEMEQNKRIVDDLRPVELKIEIIRKTIENKKLYIRKGTHPVERNVIEHGLISTSSPNQLKLEKMKSKDGVIQQVRNGFRKMYYENHRGKLLTPYDSKVLVALFKLWYIKGKTQKLEFEFRELVEQMHTEPSGGEYKTIYESLEDLYATSIVMEEYYDVDKKKRVMTINHHPISTLVWDGEERGKERRAAIEFHDIIHNSLLNGNYIMINMVLLNDLLHSTARTLYLNIINSIPDGIRRFQIDQLIEHLRLDSTNRVKTMCNIDKAFEELKSFDVIEDFRREKVGNKYEYYYFTVPEHTMNAIGTGGPEIKYTTFDHAYHQMQLPFKEVAASDNN